MWTAHCFSALFAIRYLCLTSYYNFCFSRLFCVCVCFTLSHATLFIWSFNIGMRWWTVEYENVFYRVQSLELRITSWKYHTTIHTEYTMKPPYNGISRNRQIIHHRQVFTLERPFIFQYWKYTLYSLIKQNWENVFKIFPKKNVSSFSLFCISGTKTTKSQHLLNFTMNQYI